jgi:RND family efflux transporter MFP subunit
MSGESASSRPVRRLEDLFRVGTVGDLSDGELLDRFLRDRDAAGETAFAALVERHGPMVLRVCEQALNDPNAAEDALQATFLVLARQAGTIRKRTSVSSWLFGVARRAAARIRMEEGRRRRYESRAAERSSALIAARQDAADPDPYPELHAEIERLPENERLPVMLCYFEGLSHEQAASRLRWPVGTVKTRLTRARQRLRSRLERPGRPFLLVLPAGPLRPGILAEIPEGLVHTITRAACRYATSGIPGGLVSSTVLAVTQEVMKAMLIHKLKSAAVVVCGLFLLGFGALVAAQQATGPGRAGQPHTAIGEPKAPSILRLAGRAEASLVVHVHPPLAGRVDRVLVDFGSVVKKGDPLLELFSPDLAAAKSDYELAVSQWVHDKKIYDYKKPMVETKTLPQKELIDIESNEALSQLKMRLAKDKLMIYGVAEAEINNIRNEDGAQKARMTVRSPIDGVVKFRSAVAGNYYDPKDLLMDIGQDNPLSVMALIPDRDAGKIKVGQDLTAIFPFSPDRRLKARVESIELPENPATQAARLWTILPNPDHRFKDGMNVSIEIEAEARRARSDEPHAVADQPQGATVDERLGAMERKLDHLLGDIEERSSSAKILERLSALEQKVDQLLNAQKGKSP